MNFDVLVIGGGSAGLMAAMAASAQGAKTLLIEKNNRLGRKLLLTGGGRCNVTNNKDSKDLIRHIPGNGKFLHCAFMHWDSQAVISFFENRGVKLKEEDDGRMFPNTNKAKTVVDLLAQQLREQKVEVLYSDPVKTIMLDETKQKVTGVCMNSGKHILGKKIIIATGGMCVPATGSTGDGYAWAIKAGHTITELFPTEVPLLSDEPFILERKLQGLSLQDVTLTVVNSKNKPVIRHRGNLLFTHFGLSGPIALRSSQFVVQQLNRSKEHKIEIWLDLMPEQQLDEIYAKLIVKTKGSKKTIKNGLKNFVPERLLPILLQRASIAEQLVYEQVSKTKWRKLAELMKRFPIQIQGTRKLEEAFVTGGGVNLKDIDPKTMASKRTAGLYFCGEILDIHGYTGGYNITAAFATGYTAGLNAAKNE